MPRSFRPALILGLLLLTVSPAGAQLATDTWVTGLNSPIAFVQDPTDPDVQFIVEQGGRIRVIDAGLLRATPFLDLSGSISCCGERGLLGLAFPPDAAVTGRFYVNFTNPAGHTVVARFVRTANPLVADPASRFDLRWGSSASDPRFIEQPFANHNGGSMHFGPDGYLYIAMGDGGSGNDPLRRAQDPAYLLGKMLRIDVDVPNTDPRGYVVPPDNPFVSQPSTRPEIWAFGLRNPWKFSIDDRPGGTGAIVIADVGQSSWEEVNYEPANRGGRNYGWVLREGAHNTGIGSPNPGAPATLTDPIFEYSHSVGRSITGGYVYRGSNAGMGSYVGRYFFGDFITGRVWSLGLSIHPSTGEATVSNVQEHTSQLSGGGSSVGNIPAFGQDAQGTLYIVLYSGSILRIRGTGAAVTLAADKTAPQPQGTTINWTASASGGTSPYQFKWWVNDGSGWTLARDWAASNTFAWTPSPANANYSVRVWVRSAGNTTDVPEGSDVEPFAISGPAPVSSVMLSSNRPSPQAANTTITFTATPSGGTTPYQYKWWIYNGTAWTMAANWSTTNTFAWTPTTPGDYNIGVWVRSAGNTADAAEMPHSVPFTITAASGPPPPPPPPPPSDRVTSVNLTANRASPQAAHTTTTFTATPTGGVAPHQYKWLVYNGTAWAVAADWSTTNTFAWTPTSAGDYYIGVWVKSAGNSADAAEVPRSMPFTVTAAAGPPPPPPPPPSSDRVTSVSMTANRTSPQAPGTTITFTATPTGGVAPHQYKWWIYNGTAWTMARDWSTTNTFAWTPSAPGDYYVGVWVRSSGNSADAAEVPTSVTYAIR